MKLPFIYIVLCSSFCIFLSCGKKGTLSEHQLFNQLNWKKDAIGCKNLNADMLTLMDSNRNLFYGKDEQEILDALGVPNKTELYTRGQKFFIYSLNCNLSGIPKDNLRLRFNALGYVNEVLILGAI